MGFRDRTENVIRKMLRLRKEQASKDALGNIPSGDDSVWRDMKKKWSNWRLPKKKEGGGKDFEEGERGGIKVRRRGIGARTAFVIAFLAIGVLVIAYFVQIPLISSISKNILAFPAIKSAFGEVQKGADYIGCIGKNVNYRIGSPSTVINENQNPLELSYLNALCQEETASAKESGCTECYDISVEPLNPRLFAGTSQKAVYSMTVGAKDTTIIYQDLFGKGSEQPLPAAARPRISLTAGEVSGALTPNLDIGCSNIKTTNFEGIECKELDPNIIKNVPFTITGELSGDYCDGKTNAINAEATLQYVYRAQGSAAINIRRVLGGRPVEGPFNVRDPITLAGPVKMDIIPDSQHVAGSYNAGQSKLAFVNVKFRNSGSGEATISNIHLEQITPEKASPLNVIDCTGPVEQPAVDKSKGSIDMSLISSFTLSPSDRGGGVLCSFELPQEVKSDFTTYVITGSATYEYTLNRDASTVVVDQRSCENQKTQTQTGATPSGTSSAGTTGGTGGIQQVETLK